MPDPIEWPAWDRKLAEAYHWTPQQIDQMTLPEIYSVLGGDPPPGQVVEQIQAYKTLTVEEKLDLARFLAENS